jgi:hypothetical protein
MAHVRKGKPERGPALTKSVNGDVVFASQGEHLAVRRKCAVRGRQWAEVSKSSIVSTEESRERKTVDSASPTIAKK